MDRYSLIGRIYHNFLVRSCKLCMIDGEKGYLIGVDSNLRVAITGSILKNFGCTVDSGPAWFIFKYGVFK